MKKFNEFSINEEVFDVIQPGFELQNFINPHLEKSPEELEHEYHLMLGRDGKLAEHLRAENKHLTFGMLHDIFEDALAYKRRRELKKGAFKMAHRLIPIIVAQIYIPISIISTMLGASRALDKILLPILYKPGNKYSDFTKKIILTSINLLEGDYRMFMEEDWFYNTFMIDKGFNELIKKEHLFEFAHDLSIKMAKMPTNRVVPRGYVQSELKKWVRRKFNVVVQNDLRINYK